MEDYVYLFLRVLKAYFRAFTIQIAIMKDRFNSKIFRNSRISQNKTLNFPKIKWDKI